MDIGGLRVGVTVDIKRSDGMNMFFLILGNIYTKLIMYLNLFCLT